MANQTFEASEVKVEDFSPEHVKPVSELLTKFLTQHTRRAAGSSNELGLVFHESGSVPVVDAVVDHIFVEHPELEDTRREIDQRWFDGFSEEDKKEYGEDQKFLTERENTTRYRVALASPFAENIHRAEIEHHFEATTAQHRMVAIGRDQALGYIATWTGASSLYDDHMQVDVKVVDPDLSAEDQRLVVSRFEPILDDLRLP